MPLAKTILCLAYSRKQAGRCIAGKELTPPYPWLRPVGAAYPGELTLSDIQYSGGVIPRLLDVIEIQVLWPNPDQFQTENFVTDKKKQWLKRGIMSSSHLIALLDPPEPLWSAGHSTQLGWNDRVPSDYAAQFTYSLRLIRPENTILTVRPGADARPRARIHFDHLGLSYTLAVTDYAAEGAAFREAGPNLKCDIPSLVSSSLSASANHFTTVSATSWSPVSFLAIITTNVPPSLFTIGHSNHTLEHFLHLLSLHAVRAVCDVRSTPYSQFTTQFNRSGLKRFLPEQGIQYLYLGAELGARSEDLSCYQNNRVSYGCLGRTAAFQSGLDRIESGLHKGFCIALMCAEKEPLECHRTILVSRHLAKRGIPVHHIHADGSLESHAAALERLRTLVHVPEADLFHSAEELNDEAYRRQEERIAYEPEPAAAALAAG